MASAPVGDEAICQTFLRAVGKSASRQSASQSCTRAGTCNVDHGAQSRTAAATTGTSHAATSITILSLTLLPQQVTQQKAMTVPPSTSGLFLSPCTPPNCLQSLRGLPACPRDLCPQKRTQQENGTCTAEESSFFCVARHALAGA